MFDKLCDMVRIYDHDEKCIIPIGYGDLKCRVVWTLSRYHPKHIWTSRRLPQLHSLKRAINQFTDRIKWRWFLRYEDLPPCDYRAKGLPVAPCNELVDAGLAAWLSGLQRAMIEGALLALKRARANRNRWSNMLPVTRLGLQLLRGNATAVKADKENGYVLQPLESAVKVHESILGGASYKEVAPRAADFSSMSSWYAKLCWRVSAFERDDRVAKVLLRTTRHGRTKCKLQLTCKSHKKCRESFSQEPAHFSDVGL